MGVARANGAPISLYAMDFTVMSGSLGDQAAWKLSDLTKMSGQMQIPIIGMIDCAGDAHLSFVMGVDSGMPARPELLPILKDELPQNAHWQVIATGPGREKIWDLHRRCLELGGDVRTGLEDTLYLPNGERAVSNEQLIEALVKMVREVGKEAATPEEARKILGVMG